jgi:signal peptidase I
MYMKKQDKVSLEQPNATQDKEAPAKSKGRLIYEEIMSWVKPMIAAVVFALLLDNFVIVNATVPTGSMEDTIQPGDRLMGNRLAYCKDDPQRGDIVIFKYPVDEDENYIKRIIGLPGETVEILHGKIYINGSPNALDEPYLKEEWLVQNDGFIFEVPEDCYLMLGDNRNNSLDARYWADEAVKEGLTTDKDEALNYCYVSRDKILGKAVFTYWPSFSKL